MIKSFRHRGVERFFRSGSSIFSPFVGFDTNKQFIAGPTDLVSVER